MPSAYLKHSLFIPREASNKAGLSSNKRTLQVFSRRAIILTFCPFPLSRVPGHAPGTIKRERVLEGAISKRTCVHFAKYTYMHAWSHDAYAYIGDMPDPFGMNMSLSRRRWTGILRSRHTHVCWSNNPFHLAVQRSSSFYDKPGRSFFP